MQHAPYSQHTSPVPATRTLGCGAVVWVAEPVRVLNGDCDLPWVRFIRVLTVLDVAAQLVEDARRLAAPQREAGGHEVVAR